MKKSTTKLFMHTLCVTLFILIIISFQAFVSSSTAQEPDPPPNPRQKHEPAAPPSPAQQKEEIEDYGDWNSPPYTGGGGRNTGGPIPHPWVDEEEEEEEANVSDDIHLLA
ncbi:hypothetical protein Lser_V15G18657 [Lactuca serriola]